MSIFLNSHYGKNKLTPKQIMTDPVLFLAFGFGSGLAKKAPGTCGTVAAIPVYLLLVLTGLPIYSLLTIIATLVGIWICGQAADKLGEHDFGGIVWDEVAAAFLAGVDFLIGFSLATVSALVGVSIFSTSAFGFPMLASVLGMDKNPPSWTIKSFNRGSQRGFGVSPPGMFGPRRWFITAFTVSG